MLHIVLYCHLHCGHLIDVKSYFVCRCYNFVSFNQIHCGRRKLDDVILAEIKILYSSKARIKILRQNFYSRKCGNNVKEGIKHDFCPAVQAIKWPMIVEMGIVVHSDTRGLSSTFLHGGSYARAQISRRADCFIGHKYRIKFYTTTYLSPLSRHCLLKPPIRTLSSPLLHREVSARA